MILNHFLGFLFTHVHCPKRQKRVDNYDGDKTFLTNPKIFGYAYEQKKGSSAKADEP